MRAPFHSAEPDWLFQGGDKSPKPRPDATLLSELIIAKERTKQMGGNHGVHGLGAVTVRAIKGANNRPRR